MARFPATLWFSDLGEEFELGLAPGLSAGRLTGREAAHRLHGMVSLPQRSPVLRSLLGGGGGWTADPLRRVLDELLCGRLALRRLPIDRQISTPHIETVDLADLAG
ncbi:MAG: hypothetical protein KUG77_24680, partial [Nannocystaceae bacterium]|nr:hypothetical protein [Nannocystaceae bacterium]